MAEDEQPSKKELIKYYNLYFDVYEFRNDYLIMIKENEEGNVLGATTVDETILNMFKEEEIDDTARFPLEEFLKGMELGVWGESSKVQLETYRDYLGRLARNTRSDYNRAIYNKMLLKVKFADRYLVKVLSGPLKDCVFDVEGFDDNDNKPLFLGDKINSVLSNILDKVYYRYVTIEEEDDIIFAAKKDKRRMAIATALQKEQPDRLSVLPPELVKKIKTFGGKKKRKTKRRKSLKKKKRKTKRKSRK